MKTSVSSRSAARGRKKLKATKRNKARTVITTEEFDARFDRGEDIGDYVDWSKARRPGLENRRVNVDFPAWMVDALDAEARRLGVPRQSVIKVWIAERLDS